MKRAWPYAVALAIVVTGCYLALTPLLRSLSPGATTSSNSLQQQATSATVGQVEGSSIFHGSNGGQTDLREQPAGDSEEGQEEGRHDRRPVTTTPSQTDTTTTGFARRARRARRRRPRRPSRAKAKPVKRGSGSVNGTVDPENGSGLAGAAATAARTAARTATRPATEHDAVERRRIAL